MSSQIRAVRGSSVTVEAEEAAEYVMPDLGEVGVSIVTHIIFRYLNPREPSIMAFIPKTKGFWAISVGTYFGGPGIFKVLDTVAMCGIL